MFDLKDLEEVEEDGLQSISFLPSRNRIIYSFSDLDMQTLRDYFGGKNVAIHANAGNVDVTVKVGESGE
jgi:hypothetical protein